MESKPTRLCDTVDVWLFDPFLPLHHPAIILVYAAYLADASFRTTPLCLCLLTEEFLACSAAEFPDVGVYLGPGLHPPDTVDQTLNQE